MEELTEERFLAALAKMAPGARDVAIASDVAQHESFSWERALQIAESHRVQSLLVHNLRAQDLMALFPARLRSRLPELESSASDRWTLFCDAVAPPLSDIVDEGVRVLLLKGAALALTVYPQGTRRLHDLDVLIDKADYSRTKEAFLAHDFEMLLQPGQTEASKLDAYHEIGFAKLTSEGYLGVDVHWHVSPHMAAGFLETSAVLARGRAVELKGVPLIASSPEDTFINYANQIAQDRHQLGFQRAGDIHGLVRAGLEWPVLVARVLSAEIPGRARLALGVAALLGADAPRWVLEQLERDCVGTQQATEFLVDLPWLFRRREVPMCAVPVLNRLMHTGVERRRTPLLAYWYWRAARQRGGLAARLAFTLSGYARSLTWSIGLRAMRIAALFRADGLASSIRNALWEDRAH